MEKINEYTQYDKENNRYDVISENYYFAKKRIITTAIDHFQKTKDEQVLICSKTINKELTKEVKRADLIKIIGYDFTTEKGKKELEFDESIRFQKDILRMYFLLFAKKGMKIKTIFGAIEYEIAKLHFNNKHELTHFGICKNDTHIAKCKHEQITDFEIDY